VLGNEIDQAVAASRARQKDGYHRPKLAQE